MATNSKFYKLIIIMYKELSWMAWEGLSEPIDIYDIHDVGINLSENLDEKREK